MGGSNKEVAQKWIDYAEADLETAKVLMKTHKHFTNIIVFHAQQAAEKIIKAFLVHLEIPFEKTHDLNKLLGMIERRTDFSASLYHDIEIFEKFNVQVRYPEGEFVPNSAEAQQAIINSETIVNYFKEKIQ